MQKYDYHIIIIFFRNTSPIWHNVIYETKSIVPGRFMDYGERYVTMIVHKDAMAALLFCCPLCSRLSEYMIVSIEINIFDLTYFVRYRIAFLDSPDLNWPCSLQWRHSERDGSSNHWHLDCLLSRLVRCRSKKTSKLRLTKGQYLWSLLRARATGPIGISLAINSHNRLIAFSKQAKEKK